ncbi:hypothetical protein [Nannocystis pusilla]|uniref:hypothetical protein n=1 Tax=Nannocystis pusilla TaxID=889268 RepID=UPI003B8256A0
MLDIHVLREDSARIAQNLRDRHSRVFEDLAPARTPTPRAPTGPRRPSRAWSTSTPPTSASSAARTTSASSRTRSAPP